MGRIQELWRDMTHSKDKFLVLILAGVLLLVVVWPVSDSKKTGNNDIYGRTDRDRQSNEQTDTQLSDDYAFKMESELKTILEKTEGVGKVEVMITLKGSSEQIVEKDRTYSKSSSYPDGSVQEMTSNVDQSEATIYNNTSGGVPYVVKELKPEIEGILVAAEGGGSKQIVNEITYAVQVLFDVPVHKIKVVKMSNR